VIKSGADLQESLFVQSWPCEGTLQATPSRRFAADKERSIGGFYETLVKNRHEGSVLKRCRVANPTMAMLCATDGKLYVA